MVSIWGEGQKAKTTLETVDAVIFAYLMSQYLGFPTSFAATEDADYDGVLRVNMGESDSFNPFQLKQIVPYGVNPDFSYEDFVSGLEKYKDSNDLIVAIKVGREISKKQMSVGDLNFSGVFFFGHEMQQESKRLWIYGDCQMDPIRKVYPWPDLCQK